MGAHQFQPFNAQLQQYRILEDLPEKNHTHLVHNKTEKEYLLRELTFTDQNTFKKSQEEHKKRQAFKQSHLTQLYKIQVKQIDQLCTNIFKIYTLWEYPYRFLSEEIQERKYQKRKFEERQLWSILASCVMAMSTLQKYRIRHQSLTTNAMLLDSDGVLKIVDPLALATRPNLESVYENRLIKGIYLSPEQCEALQSKGAYNNPFKNDVWAMGVILLECGLFESQDYVYKDELQRIDYSQLQRNLDEFGKIYGQELQLVIQLMLKRDSKDRPDWIDLQKFAHKSAQNSNKKQHPNLSYNSANMSMAVRHELNKQTPRATFLPNNVFLNKYQAQKMYYKPQQNLHGQNLAYRPISAQPIRYTPAQYKSSTVYQQSNGLSSYHPPTYESPLFNNIVVPGTYSTNYYPSSTKNYQNIGIVPPSSNTKQPLVPQYSIPKYQSPKYQKSNLFTNPNLLNQPIIKISPKSINNQIHHIKNTPPPVKNQINSNTPIYNLQPREVKEKKQEISKNQNVQLEYVVETFKQGSRYEGYKLNDMRHGEGKFYYQDGGLYDGNWKCNKMDGQGLLFYQSGKIAYEGGWRNDQFHGHGKLFNQNPLPLSSEFDYRNFDEIDEYWEHYEGDFVEDFKKGHGELKLSNGQIFEGTFDNDMVEGPGIFHRLDGTVVKGTWRANQLEHP